MVMLSRTNIKKVLSIILVCAVLSTPVAGGVIMVEKAKAISLACRNSAACMEAVQRERDANANVAQAMSSANLFQARVQELNLEIASRELQIAETTAQVNDLNRQIKETEEKLEDEQEALAELLINMHFEGDAEPITILAGSNSISDLAEKQARSEVVKQQISTTAKKIKEEKKKLEEDKAKVEELLAEQKAAKAELVSKRAEQQSLVEKYQNDAAAYAAVAAAAQAAQRAAEQKEQEEHPERYRGSSYSGVNTYPWQDNCPQEQDNYGTVWNGSYIGGLVCECVSYVGWKAYEAYGLTLAWHNASNWDDTARRLGYRVDNTPEPDSIGQYDIYPYGHVFWVESVNADGSINVTEYNNASATQLYSGVYRYGDFGARTISAGSVRYFNYIHLR